MSFIRPTRFALNTARTINEILSYKVQSFELRLKKACQKVSPGELFRDHDFKHMNHRISEKSRTENSQSHRYKLIGNKLRREGA
uniref:ribosomal protein L29 n=1 Tax=Haramonas pauciplastida TaxID=478668 RepID=UPI0021147A7F|nr:ribosomal protein L29 [Haramonas pauciplastida]UTE94973.1 ribosomal protein L29 [Haramonas pauciplastida]